MTVKMKTLAIGLSVVGMLASQSLTTPARAASPQLIRVGANLSAYVPPPAEQCDVRVPLQYPTVQAGVDAAAPGDTVCVDRGKFSENVVINKSLRLSGDGARKTILNGTGTDASISTIYIAGDGNADNVIVEGFLIRGVDSIDTDRNDPTAVNIGPKASGTKLRYNRIEAGNAELAVRADSLQSNALMSDNVFVGQYSPELFKVSGVQGPSGRFDFVNNTFEGSVDAATPNFSGAGTVLDTWATNSLIQQNQFGSSGTITAVVASAYASNAVTTNNLDSSSSVKVGTYSGGTLDAENNWWGDLDPSDNVHGDVDFTPFATHPYPQ